MNLSKRLSVTLVLGLLAALVTLPALYAQTTANAPAATNALGISPSSSGQAPDDMPAKITELVHARKYTEAQQLTTGLLAAYPNDQRLIKAKALLDKLPTSAGSANPDQNSNQPNNVVPAQPAANTSAEELTGMDKVDYSALIELAKAAEQNTDLEQQKASLKQFMDRSSPFLRKHPEEMLLWQLRAASAINLNDPLAGYEAGQKLLAAGAADSSDPNFQSLLGQLKNKGWLDKQEATKQAEALRAVILILGSWTVHFSWADQNGHDFKHGDYGEECSRSDSVIECSRDDNSSNLRGVILDSGEINWEEYGKPLSFEISNDKRTMKSVVTGTAYVGTTAFGKGIYKKGTLTIIYTKK